jgi:hypothetical protein
MIFIIKSYLFNKLAKSLANACIEVSNASKSLIAICFGYQSTPQKIITREKMS